MTGEPLPRTPKYMVRVSADKDFSLGNDFDLLTSLSYNWRDDQNLDAYGTFNADQDAYGVVDGFIRLVPASERWLVELWGSNLTDEYYRTSSFFYSAILGSVNQSQIGRPRSYGLRVRYDF
ncbi:MAG: TonB-dependent receptor [Acidobacteria bacterium]|nr:TonB-dependent receptor [Acidobacteriota bacterium]